MPRLNNLMVGEAKALLDNKARDLASYHEKLLEWESAIATTNHYFVDTVQSIHSTTHNADVDGQERPACLRHLTPMATRKMSNEEQKLVDEQIETFACWKLLKKRLVCCITLSTHSELAMNPLNDELKPLLLDQIFSQHNDEQLVKLMSPDEAMVKRRMAPEERLGKLREAMKEIEMFRSKHIGDVVDIETND